MTGTTKIILKAGIGGKVERQSRTEWRARNGKGDILLFPRKVECPLFAEKSNVPLFLYLDGLCGPDGDWPLSRSNRPDAGPPLTGLDRATTPPGRRTE